MNNIIFQMAKFLILVIIIIIFSSCSSDQDSEYVQEEILYSCSYDNYRNASYYFDVRISGRVGYIKTTDRSGSIISKAQFILNSEEINDINYKLNLVPEKFSTIVGSPIKRSEYVGSLGYVPDNTELKFRAQAADNIWAGDDQYLYPHSIPGPVLDLKYLIDYIFYNHQQGIKWVLRPFPG